MLLNLIGAMLGIKSCDAKFTGEYGEFLTKRELNLVRLFGRTGKILNNIYLPKDNGETSEIDILFITQKGIFVIESKNYSGYIYGNEKNFYWIQELSEKNSVKFYNPVMQNQTHIKWLKEYLKEDIPMFSFVVFSERCTLKNIVCEETEAKVIRRDSVYATVRNIWNTYPDILDTEEINSIYKKLKPLTKVSSKVKREHIQAVQATCANQSQKICLLCGANLILRTAKKGVYAGKQFYGCASYPNCKYILEKTD